MKNPYLIGGLILIFGVIDLVILGRAFDLGKADWAAWVQAVGSIGAILAAVWVSYNQHEKQREIAKQRETEEVLGMLYSLRSEIETSIQSIESDIGARLAEIPGPEFNVTYPVSDNPFPIYTGLIPKLGMIRPHQVRKQIVLTYALAQGLVMTFRLNNQLIDEHEAASNAPLHGSQESKDSKTADQAWHRLADYGVGLRKSYAEVVSHAKALLELLPKA
jgi:hypothetical protein